MSSCSRSILSALRILPSQRPSMARLESPSTFYYIRSSTAKSTVLASAGKNPEQAHRAARSEDIPSRLSLPMAVSDHIQRRRLDLCLVHISSDVRFTVKRPLHRSRELSDHQRMHLRYCRAMPAMSCFMIDSAVVLLDCILSWRWVLRMFKLTPVSLSYLASRCTVPSTARRTIMACLGSSSLFR
jgi:hypothetical protein